jgi:hypothetical protein
VRITEIAFDGQSFKAPELEKKRPKVKKAAAVEEHEGEAKTAKGHGKKKAAPKKGKEGGFEEEVKRAGRAGRPFLRDFAGNWPPEAHFYGT